MLLPAAARASIFTAPDLLERAITAMGGRALLSRVKALHWSGRAQVEAGGRTLEIDVNTRVAPFVRARTETRLVGSGDLRTLIIEPGGGWIERNHTRTPLPAEQAVHERQQYGLYGYMLLVRAPTHVVGDQLVAERRGLPPVTFLMEGDAVMGADYAVASPDGVGSVAQRFLLEGELNDHGIRWPQTITILQNDRLYFMLDLESFSVELA
ncbi:MAG TPA: hypothetical protein VN029_04950 [Sphingomonas sp.]|nr:hypothetical protein [Sphingomonas sp.]